MSSRLSLTCNSPVSILVTPVFVHKKEFLFPNSLKGFWRSLVEILQLSPFNNSSHLKDLVIRILWTLVMSFSDALTMILTVILTVYQAHDFKTPSGDYDKWRVFGKSKSKNTFCTHWVSCVDCVLSFHKLQRIHFWSAIFSKKPKDAKQDNSISKQLPCNYNFKFLVASK